MEVILLERIEKLGQMGETVKVRNGYARNFLLPQKKALRANAANLALFEARRAELEALNLQRREAAQELATHVDGLRLVIVRQAGESGMLYGSVSARDIADSVKDAGYAVERRLVNLDAPIKSLGAYNVRVALHPEVSVSVVVVIARSLEEAARNTAAPVDAQEEDVAEAEEIVAEDA